MSNQPAVQLPTATLIRADLAATLVAVALGLGGTLLLGKGLQMGLQTALGAGLAGVVALAGTWLIGPDKTRPVLLWANLLIALASGRLVVSAGAILLLYFAAQMSASALLCGMLLTLAIVLLAETIIAARCFSKATPADTVETTDT